MEVVHVRVRERAFAVSCAAEPGISPMRGTDQRADGGGMNTGAALILGCLLEHAVERRAPFAKWYRPIQLRFAHFSTFAYEFPT